MNHLLRSPPILSSTAKTLQISSSLQTLLSPHLSLSSPSNSENHPKLHNQPSNHVPINTHLPNSSNQQKPISKPTSNDQITPKLTQIRYFSTIKSDPRNPNSSKDPSKPIDAGTSIRKPVSFWPGVYHSPVTNALWEARSNIIEKVGDGETFSQDGLVSKSPSQSRTSVEYKFSCDYVLREQYRNPWNRIRMGKLVEDLDALAGTISYKHCCNNGGMTRPLILVTAAVDKILLKKPIQVDADLTLVGAVTWVGRSSMEMQLEVLQPLQDTPQKSDPLALVANFTFVARDAETGKSAPINQISPETEQEILLWERAEARNKMRKRKRKEEKNEIDQQKVERINELLAEGRVFVDLPALADRDSILIRDTCLRSSIICQPQQRNIHGRIFGGFLMRKAFELAFSTAYTFAGAAPRFVEVDHVDFVKPVDVGNFLRMKSCVLYTELDNPDHPLINVEVVAHVTRPELRTSEVSNKFYFTFSVCPEAIRKGLKIRSVFPAAEEEARQVIERIDAENSPDD